VKRDIWGPGTVAGFIETMRNFSKLQYPRYVLRFYGVAVNESDNTVRGILTPPCEKGSLNYNILSRRGRNPWSVRLEWARQIIHGLADIHKAGFYHSNLTLATILVDRHFTIKIFTTYRNFTPRWEPPEVPVVVKNTRLPLEAGIKSDLYQLGMVLWALATEDCLPELKPRPLKILDEDEVPTWFAHIVNVCLSLDPGRRLPATELLSMFPPAQELESMYGGSDIPPPPPPPARPESISSDSESEVDEDDLFDNMSITSIETSITTASSTDENRVNEAVVAFVDLLYETIDLRKLALSSLSRKRITMYRLRNGIRRLLKLLSRDLQQETQASELREASAFFMSFSRRLSSAILENVELSQDTDFNAMRATHQVEEVEVDKPEPKQDDSNNSDDAEDSDASDESDKEAEPERSLDVNNIRDVVKSTRAFEVFVASIVEMLAPPFEVMIKGFSKVVKDPDGEIKELMSELLYSRPLEISLVQDVSVSYLDMLRNKVEEYTEIGWDWWPLDKPQKSLPDGYSRLSWQCVSSHKPPQILILRC
jgi:serine/threonine protein kinase